MAFVLISFHELRLGLSFLPLWGAELDGHFMTFLSAILALSDGQVNGKGDDSRRLLKMEYIQLSAILDISVKKGGITGQLFRAIKPPKDAV